MTPATPIPAATVLALRASPEGPEIFMVRRHARIGFFGGAFVFPGGRLDAADADPDADRWCDGVRIAASGLVDLLPAEAVAYHLAALRELFEEAGILVARHAEGRTAFARSSQVADLSRERDAVHAGELTLRQALEPHGLRPALDLLVALAHWVTPAIEPKRFDTRFFLVVVENDQPATHDRAENVDSAWMTAAEALARFDREEIVLAPPTWRILKDLRLYATPSDIVRAAKARVIRRVEPRFVREDGHDWLVLPGDPRYPAPPEERFTPPTRFRRDPDRWEPC